MANRDVINSILKEQLLRVIFPKIFRSYASRLKGLGAYMVVIGGVSVEMCAKMDKNASMFLKNVFSEDVDIKVVIEKEDTDIDAVHNVRVEIVKKLVKYLNRFIQLHHHKWDQSIQVNVKIDESLLNHEIDAVRNARVVSIVVEYTESKYHIKYPLVDTTFFSATSTPHYDVYYKLMNTKHHVPYYVSNFVNFATCEYMMYDTCRMLVDRAQYLKEKKSLFALMKFTKYVVKFMSLYILKKKLKMLPQQLVDIYDNAHKTLLRINTFKIKNGFKKMYSIKYDTDYIEKVVKKLDIILKSSDMKQLVKAATHV